jgi:hypothetical protein
MNLNIPILLLVLFILKHLICDFFLQSSYQTAGKHKFLHPGGVLHAAIHGVGTMVVLAIAVPTIGLPAMIWLGLADMFSHYAIDYMKTNGTAVFKLVPENHTYWTLFAIDQAIHWIMYVLFMFFAVNTVVVYGPFVGLTITFSMISVGLTRHCMK